MDVLLPQWLKATIGIGVIAALLLVEAARRFPNVVWLRMFRVPDRLDPAQRAEMKRLADRRTGVEMILAGILVPSAYFVLTLMTWGDFSLRVSFAIGFFSFACIVFGGWNISRTGPSQP
jgi:hypothetical protein